MKLFLFILCVCILTACQSNEDVSNEQQSVSLQDENVNADSKILIAYFTWADNTQVDDPSSVDVDASTSASVLSPGNTEKIANFIHEWLGIILCLLFILHHIWNRKWYTTLFKGRYTLMRIFQIIINTCSKLYRSRRNIFRKNNASYFFIVVIYINVNSYWITSKWHNS